MNIVIYGNGSAGNHGCEAITRGTISALGKDNNYIIQSAQAEDDVAYGLHELAEIRPAVQPIKKDFRFIASYLRMKLTGSYTEMDGLGYVSGIRRAAENATIALSVGGDNYCYPGAEIYGWMNKEYHRHGLKTVLWGCSIEPEKIKNKTIAKDLALYDLVVARESITYEAIKQVQSNVILAPDPAFFMSATEWPIDARFEKKNIIGINISPMIIANEKATGMAYENYKHLIAYILNNTDASIALIPHVVWKSNDDRVVLRKLFDDFDQNPRLILIEDHTAPELKYIISKCSMFIGARTHATIAAYSTHVPTLVVGYSVKARGIARDLFGTEEGYVLPVQSLTRPEQLKDTFQRIWVDRDSIHSHLKCMMPGYVAKSYGVEKLLGRVTHEK